MSGIHEVYPWTVLLSSPHFEQISNKKLTVPEHLFIPLEMDGRRPARVCWMKGYEVPHNFASCPWFLNYLQQHPHMDGKMPNEWVRPVPANSNQRGDTRRK